MTFMKRVLSSLAILSVLVLTACGGSGSGSNPKIDGIDGPHVSVVNGSVFLSVVFKNMAIDGGATIPIPKYPGSTFQIGPDFQSGGTLLSMAIAVPDFLGNQGAGLDPQTLPGGRMLPGVASGSLPAIAVEIPSFHNSVLYVGPSVIGMFTPFKGLDMAGSIVTFRFYGSDNNAVGNLSLVGSDASGENSGLLVLMDPSLLGIKGNTARLNALKSYIKAGYR